MRCLSEKPFSPLERNLRSIKVFQKKFNFREYTLPGESPQGTKGPEEDKVASGYNTVIHPTLQGDENRLNPPSGFYERKKKDISENKFINNSSECDDIREIHFHDRRNRCLQARKCRYEIPLFYKSGLGVVFPTYPTARRFSCRREGEENARESASGDAAVQFVTKPEIKQHRE